MSAFLNDVVSSVRGLWRTRLFTFVAVVTIALASGVAGSVFGVVDTLVLRSLPYPESDRLVAVRSGMDKREKFPLSIAEYVDYRLDSESVDDVGAYAMGSTMVQAGNGAVDIRRAAAITPSLQRVLGLETEYGRTFTDEEGLEGGPDVALVSNAYWKSNLGSDPAVVNGGTLLVSGDPTEIVGVVRDGFALPGSSPAIYVPLHTPNVPVTENRSGHNYNVIARLKEGVTLEEAGTEGVQLMAKWEREFAGSHLLQPRDHALELSHLSEFVLGDISKSIGMLVWAAILVIVLSCANLSTLMLARGETRRTELGVRSAMGAGFGRLTRLVLIESTSIALVGGVLGVGISGLVLWWVGAQKAGSLQVGVNSLDMASIDLRLAAVTILVAAVSGITFGLFPAFAAKKFDLVHLLSANGGRSRSGGRNLRRAFNSLVFVQLALAAVLLNGTVMLVDGFLELARVDHGFVAEDRMAFRIHVESTEYEDGDPLISLHDRMLESLSTVPGVESVAAARSLPLRSGLGTEAFIKEGEAYSDGDPSNQVYFQMASPGYYKTMGIPLLAGRAIDERDRPQTPKVAMLNRAAAETYFGSVENAYEQRVIPLFMGGPDAEPTTIIGISENVRHGGPVGEVKPEIVLPIVQAKGWNFSVLRGTEWVVKVDPRASASVMSGIRAKMASIAPGVPILGVAPMSEAVRESVAYERFLAQLTTAFGLVALAIAAVGVLGVVWFGVNSRWREFGVRMALGQTPISVTVDVVGRGLKLGIAAAVTGTVATFMGSRVVTTVIHSSGRPDPLLIAITTSVLLGVVVVACLVPAVKAGRIDPARVLGAD